MRLKHPGYIFSFVIFALVLLCGSVYAQTQDARPYTLVTVAEGLDYPWSVAFLPDGDMLVSERPGALVRINAQGEKTQIKGLPPVVARRQGGLLGLALDPEFEHNRLLYFSYVARGMGGTGTQVARAELRDDILHDVRVIFKAVPKMRSDVHFGSRLLFAPDGKLFITLGERFDMRQAQDRSNHLGSLIRINPDGSIPDDNPFVGQEKIRPKIYSYGHRNMQGIALQPGTNTIWAHEHGPKGGDEVNIIKPGANYGWPKITYGIDYDGTIISTETEAPGMEQPVTYWTPSIAPSGMSFYTGDKFPDWQGDLFVGALAGTHLRHLSVNGQQITAQDILLEELGERIRDVATGPDGYLYVLTDSHDGRLIRLEPRHQR
ncbi:MAG: PQQ-dependent sugar dehydrogenase [Rhodospirillales bacterium]|nr:PQQ-dependent sugar dehydrogenase [Rhodospirillales bacterium]MCB9997164.1 PQQ-dependent sugar dehydrogenase [Rhodospirillales bacterium]